ncbi:28425_t:CDS:2, partial [Gigaspora margarita]
MRDCELWRNASDAEFENAKEGMEKLVMNRLYKLTFSPAIKGPVTTDDRERDEILQQKIQIFRWVKEEHLDITHADHNEQYFEFAKNELLKINFFKAPRDKLICILNCCKVIFGLIRHVDGEESADKFLPILIFVVLKANPDNLVSNV